MAFPVDGVYHWYKADFLRYAAWLVETRHAPQAGPDRPVPSPFQLPEAAEAAAALAVRPPKGGEEKLAQKQETLIAALLTEPTCSAAAARAGISRSTVYRWLKLPAFRAAYRRARREVVDAALARIQAFSGEAAEALIHVIALPTPPPTLAWTV